MKKKTVPFILSLCILLSFMSALSGCSADYPFDKGCAVIKTMESGKECTVGDTEKTGWQIDVPADTFGEAVELTMNVLSEADSQSYLPENAKMIGTPVELKLKGQENVRLGQPVKVTLKLPKEQLNDLAAEELLYGYYYDGEWSYYMPENINMEQGTACFQVYHFSFLGFFKPSEEEQIKAFADNYATLQWESSRQKQQLTDALAHRYNDLFKSIGVTSDSVRNQLTADVLSYLEDANLETGGLAPIDALAQMANAASKGQDGMQDFQNKLLEFTGKGLTATLEEIHNVKPGEYAEKFASKVNVLGNLSSALGYILEGDNKGALESVAGMLKGVAPVVALTSSALDYVKQSMENTISYWTQDEIEKAYQVYIGGGAGKYGYDSGLEGDINSIFTTLGGGERMMNIKIVKKYCEKYGINEDDLTQEYRDKIVADALKALKNNFDQRKASEAEINEIKQKQESFIAALKQKGLLGASSHQKFFGIDKLGSNYSINGRLAKLYQLRALVLRYVDADKIDKLTDEQIATLIEQWVHWSENKDRASFFKYLRECGYNEEPVSIDPSYAWVLVDTEDFSSDDRWKLANEHVSYDYEYSYGRGTYSAKCIYTGESDNYYNPPVVKGEALGLQAVFSSPPQVIHPDEPVTITLSLSVTSNTQSFFSFSGSADATFDEPGIEAGYGTGGAIPFVNSDGKDYFTISKNTNYADVNETLTAKLSAGREGKRIALRTGFSYGVPMCTNYIYEWKEIE